MNDLVKIALAGTTKASVTAPATRAIWDDGWDTARVEREWELLLRAGADVSVRLAGYVAPSGVPLPQPAKLEQLTVCSDTVALMLKQHTGSSGSAILLEALTLLARKRRRLPPSLLPWMLAVKDPLCRKALRPVLGERGRWLSQFNPAWRWAGETSDSQLPPDALQIWEQGTQEYRLRVLALCRTERPAEARVWVEQVWRAEKADFRAQALAMFRSGLSLEDELFLEQALDDRSQNVRTCAADLLATLDGSALIGRMRDRADAILQYTPPPAPGRLQKFIRSIMATAAQGTFTVTLPDEFEKSWQRDGIAEEPPPDVGPRIWWFTQIIANVPPTQWEARWNINTPELVAIAAADPEHGPALLKGWSEATIRYRDAEWAQLLWHAWANLISKDRYYEQYRINVLAELVEVLPPQQADTLALEQFRQPRLGENARMALMRALPTPWSPTFARLFLESAYPHVTGTSASNWQDALQTASVALPHEAFVQAFHDYGTFRDNLQAWQITTFLDTLEIRQRFYEEINR